MTDSGVKYTPTIAQYIYGTDWHKYEVPEYVSALFMAVKEEIERVVWNRDQKEWEGYDDPNIPGVTWRPYYWGDEDEEAAKPNFVFDGVEICWYKYPGRGMSTNIHQDALGWTEWFSRVIAAIRLVDWEDELL